VSSSCLSLIDSVFLCVAVNFDIFSFPDAAMLVSILQERNPFRYIHIY